MEKDTENLEKPGEIIYVLDLSGFCTIHLVQNIFVA